MARTRSTKGTTAPSTSTTTTKTTTATTTTKYSLPAESENPPRVFILPKKATPAARIVTLSNPRYARPSRYLVCPEAGFFEFTRISAPKTAPRSWLLEAGSSAAAEAQTTKGAELYLASPIDPLFLVLPALAGSGQQKKRMFLTSDDHFDALSESSASSHLSEVLRWPGIRPVLERRMAAVCDTVEAGDESMFRLNESKLLDEILAKTRRMSELGFPKSMEEKFVAKVLEAPILGVRSSQAVKPTGTTTAAAQEEEESSATQTPSAADSSSESQSTVSSLKTSASSLSESSTSASTPATSVDDDGTEPVISNAMTAPAEAVRLQRLRVSFNFICSSYVAPPLAAVLKDKLAEAKDKADFKVLDEYLTQLTELRQEAVAARAVDYSRKHTLDEEEDERAEKRRKKEEEDKVKKANQSRGVNKLKKVNTTGMKKMSEFFKKK
ncbi:ribonuclease H2, subunit B [Bombardia bombarda]|uniref:Ribonuclease H2 subunit B n=1 Tax=Bombardia bombarda TaxID=252184 RepID=A0AA40C976_9PEZI|nr:ribonuclease H2, subunit B [Bombardia bombarda]